MKYFKFFLLFVMLFSTQASYSARYYACKDLRDSVDYPRPSDLVELKGNKIFTSSAMLAIREASKIIATASLGVSGLPISLSAMLLFKALSFAGIEIGKNKRVMIAVIVTSEALVNGEIDINTNLGKEDLIVLEDFIGARVSFNKHIKKVHKKQKLEGSPKILNNLEFAKLVMSLEGSEGDDFFCKKKKNGKVRFRGYRKASRDILYNNLDQIDISHKEFEE